MLFWKSFPKQHYDTMYLYNISRVGEQLRPRLARTFATMKNTTGTDQIKHWTCRKTT